MTAFELFFTFFSLAIAVSPHQHTAQYDQRPTEYVDLDQAVEETGNYIWGAFGGNLQHADCDVLTPVRIGVPIDGPEMLTNGTHWFTTEGYNDWMVALHRKGLSYVSRNEGHQAIPGNYESVDNQTERYLTLVTEEVSTFIERVTIDQFVTALNDTISRHRHNDLVQVGRAGFMRLISGDSEPNFDLSALQSSSAPLYSSGIGLPKYAACLRFTQGKNRKWTIAFGSDNGSVNDVSCDYFTSKTRSVHINIPKCERKRKSQIWGSKNLNDFLSRTREILSRFSKTAVDGVYNTTQ